MLYIERKRQPRNLDIIEVCVISGDKAITRVNVWVRKGGSFLHLGSDTELYSPYIL